MFIILEGPDGAGKSTLGEVLSKSLGGVLLHTGGPIQSENEFKERTSRLSRAIEHLRFRPIVLDRIPYISEYVYGDPPVIPEPILENQFYFFCNMHKPHIIYCRTDVETRVKNIVSGKPHKPDNWVEHVTETAPKIQERYDSFFSQYPPQSVYNYKDTKADVRSLPVL